MSTTTATAANATSTAAQAAEQAGIIAGANPTHFNASNPITVFLIQAGIIIIFCRVLHWPLSRIRQPRVIAEVIGGIVLGPTVMGRIPGFSNAIFPQPAMPVLNAAANLGLILFLFVVGLETDLRLLKANWKVAVSVSGASMVIPFGLGAGIAVGLYNEFGKDKGVKPVDLGVFILFIGIAMAITAFPVLARILTELKLLGTNVGVITLSAGVGNDVVGWILLALSVALINTSSGLTALWVLLATIGWVTFLIIAVRPVFVRLLRARGALDTAGPSQGIVALTILMVFTSSFFTDVIGVHPIFGAFVIGLICPHEGGFAVRLTEKIEDLVGVVFLPLYFALSGLRTNVGLLSDGLVWGYTIAVIIIAFVGKMAGGTLSARYSGLLWRESFTVGTLMSCKGLVELIVLNIGYTAGIISQRVFTMFVVMYVSPFYVVPLTALLSLLTKPAISRALVTTFSTTPIVSYLYPPWYQRKVEQWRRGEINWDGTPNVPDEGEMKVDTSKSTGVSRVTALLRLDCMPSLIAFISLLRGPPKPMPQIVHASKNRTKEELGQAGEVAAALRNSQLEVYGFRLTDLGERPSTIMKASEELEFSDRDPVVNVFRTFGRLNNIATAASVMAVPENNFAETLTSKSGDVNSDLLLIPWSETGSMGDQFEQFIGSREHRFSTGIHNHFILSVIERSNIDTAIFINKGFAGSFPNERRQMTRKYSNISRQNTLGLEVKPLLPVIDPSHHIFFPYVGGADDRAALKFVLQLVKNPNVTATILHVIQNGAVSEVNLDQKVAEHSATAEGSRSGGGTGAPEVRSVLRGSIGDNIPQADRDFYMSIAQNIPEDVMPRIAFETVETNKPLSVIISRAQNEVGQNPKNAGDLIIVGRNHGESPYGIRSELFKIFSSNSQNTIATDTKKALGEIAEGVIVSNLKASLLVFKARLEQ